MTHVSERNIIKDSCRKRGQEIYEIRSVCEIPVNWYCSFHSGD